MSRPEVSLRCVLCSRVYPQDMGYQLCPEHDGLDGILDVEYENAGLPDAVSMNSLNGLIRYANMLPLPPAGERVLPADYLQRTPLLNAPRLAEYLDLAKLWIKDEGRNPTGSLKDRSSALAVELALAGSYSDIACASTGNAAASLAGACAVVGINARIFVPESTPAEKLAQLRAFGAYVLLVRGSYDDAYYLCQDAVAELGWYNRNCAINPLLIEGKKTCGLEIAEQLQDQEADWLSVAVGDGCTVSALGKALTEMLQLGRLKKLPRLLAVQAQGASPIVSAFFDGDEKLFPVTAATVADCIAVGKPRNFVKALRAVRQSGGVFCAVSDNDMLEERERLSRLAGVFAEPGAAAGIAAIRAARRTGLISKGDRVIHVVTGSGMKAPGKGVGNLGRFHTIEPKMGAVRGVLSEERHARVL